MIFSTLLGEINAHKVQLVSYHQKTNGLLIRIVVNNVPKAGNIAGWVGQENWFYLTINEENWERLSFIKIITKGRKTLSYEKVDSMEVQRLEQAILLEVDLGSGIEPLG